MILGYIYRHAWTQLRYRAIPRAHCAIVGHDDRLIVGQDRVSNADDLNALMLEHVCGKTSIDLISAVSYRRCFRCHRIEGRVPAPPLRYDLS